MPLLPDRDGIVRIGNPRGKIAVYVDEDGALAMADRLYPGDLAHTELLEAVRAAYPEDAPTLDIPAAAVRSS